MPMTRQQLRQQAQIMRYQSDKKKPPTRKQAQAWMAPMKKALEEVRTGEVDSHRGYAITRFNELDNDFARIDFAINGFLSLITRLNPDFNIEPFTKVSKKLETGVLLSVEEVDACISMLAEIEEMLISFKRQDLIDAANTEMVAIELERLGLKEAA